MYSNLRWNQTGYSEFSSHFIFVHLINYCLSLNLLLCFLVFVPDLRRSPRIKKFARRHSNVFYSSSQPRSRNLERALSASQLSLSDGKISGINVKMVRSPMRLLFGAAESPSRLSDPPTATRATRSRLYTDSSVFEVSSLISSWVQVHQCLGSGSELRRPSGLSEGAIYRRARSNSN